MKYLFVILILVFVSNQALGDTLQERDEETNGVYDYHLRVGIPKAKEILEYEQDLLARPERIVGGGSSFVASHPHQAGILITILWIYTSVCGGTLISDRAVLTAAHCHNDGNNIAQSMTIVLGSSLLSTGGTRVQLTGVILHPGYNPNILANDLAVLRIPSVSFSTLIQPANLPSGSELSQNFAGLAAVASGYGITSDGSSVSLFQTLGSVNLRVIANNECSAVYGSIVQDHHICTSGAGGVGTCDGDTGGPLTTTSNGRRILIGINSFYAAAGCSAGLPSAFIRVTNFVQWIWSVA